MHRDLDKLYEWAPSEAIEFRYIDLEISSLVDTYEGR